MTPRRVASPLALVLLLVLSLWGAAPAMAEPNVAKKCPLANAAGPVERPPKAKKVKKPIALQPDAQSAHWTVNLGTDREAEVLPMRVEVAGGLRKRKLVRQLELASTPFTRASETAETIWFDPTFSRPVLSGNGKWVAFRMCVDPPNDLPAGKYTATVMLDGPPQVSGVVMAVTVNGKDGSGFALGAFAAFLVALAVLLYKAASDKRATAIAKAEKLPEGERDEAMAAAEKWRLWTTFWDLGWLVPTIAALAGAFATLWFAYNDNPAWGEGGLLTNLIALIGTGLAAVGVRTIFSPSTPKA